MLRRIPTPILSFIVLFNFTLLVVEQGRAYYTGELIALVCGDSEEKTNHEKEWNEKETCPFFYLQSFRNTVSSLENSLTGAHFSDLDLLSENHSTLPELPPEA